MNTSTKVLIEQICSKYLDKKDQDKCKLYYSNLAKELPSLNYNQCLICSNGKNKNDLEQLILIELSNYINSFS